jgi:D-glucosaminate-6-phosphate ammonia-lyase
MARMKEDSTTAWVDLGVPPAINAMGRATILGGSTLSETAIQALIDANDWYVDMKELLLATGAKIAPMLGAESAIATSGSTAAIMIGTAACMTGDDVEKIERLPNTNGMKNQVVCFRRVALPELGYRYSKCFADVGATLVWAGDDSGGTTRDMERCITSETALLATAADAFVRAGNLPSVEEVISLGKERSVPVFVDAAGSTFPLDEMTRYARAGADLVTYGGKYFNGPQATGILCGNRALIDAAFLHTFIGWQYGTLGVGRAMKVDRQSIAAMVVALEEWFAMDHNQRLGAEDAKVAHIEAAIASLPGVRVTRCRTAMVGVGEPIANPGDPAGSMVVELDPEVIGREAIDVASALQAGNPSIWVMASRPGLVRVTTTQNTIGLTMSCIGDGHEEIIADRLKALLSPA